MKRAASIGCALWIASLVAPTLEADEGGWAEATPGRTFTFPADHAAHPDHRIEWWYYTGNVTSETGRRFGFQLTFFRTGVRKEPANPSRWAVRDLWLAHFAVSDIAEERFHAFDRLRRRGPGLAGAELAETSGSETVRIWNDDWQATIDGDGHRLVARSGEVAIELDLRGVKPAIFHGDAGYSRKGASEGNASHYYSLPRLDARGVVTVGGVPLRVTGTAWMDHEFGTTFLERNQRGWDWLSIQLADGRELMLFRLRRDDGSADQWSSGTFVESDGTARPIAPGKFTLEPRREWRSASGASYPVAWRVHVPELALELDVEAAFDAQELRVRGTTGVEYWEGSVTATGRIGGAPAEGVGYLELTGYGERGMGEILGSDR